MTAKKTKAKSFDLPPNLVEAWDEQRHYSPSAAGAMFIWLTLTPDLQDQAMKAAFSKDVKEKITRTNSKIKDTVSFCKIFST